MANGRVHLKAERTDGARMEAQVAEKWGKSATRQARSCRDRERGRRRTPASLSVGDADKKVVRYSSPIQLAVRSPERRVLRRGGRGDVMNWMFGNSKSAL